MLNECDEHGYFRGESCPVCKKKGKFLMNEREMGSLSRIIAGALRHFPEKLGLNMDGHGWVDISLLIDSIGTSRSGFNWLRTHHIKALVETDPRGRYQLDGGMIRAKYGHSIDVDLDDLPLSEADVYFYPVTEEESDIVIEGGIHPVDRKWVHLSNTLAKAIEAGKVRTELPMILKIDGKQARLDGVKIYQASDDVSITDNIDSKYISKVDEKKIQKAMNEKS